MLALDIELLTGWYRASNTQGTAAEWPPHPERVFSALVQAWGDGDERDSERAALEWLEKRPPPTIEADSPEETLERDAPTVFVPPNDTSGAKLEVLPEHRKRQARSFHALSPRCRTVRLVWNEPAPPEVLRALQQLAPRVASIGHSSSLTRCAFIAPMAGDLSPERTWTPGPGVEDVGTWSDLPGSALRMYYSGRLAELHRWFHGMDGVVQRPLSRHSVWYVAPRDAPARPLPASSFGRSRGWFVFESRDQTAPDILATAHVARRARDALMHHCARQDLGVPELLSGHARDGNPSRRPHVAIVPLSNVGWEHSTGELLGFAVVLPDRADPEQRGAVLRAIASFSIAALDAKSDSRHAALQLSKEVTWNLERVALPSRSSLHPARWCTHSRTWASVTPLLLDQFPKEKTPTERAEIVSRACARIGLPEPTEIELHEHSAVRGAVSAYPARGRRERPDWSFPKGSKFAPRPRLHVVLRFAEPVIGPVILGAGRYHGLGLCLPIHGSHP